METDVAADIPTLYTHTKRPAWGRAILAWAREDKRAYQFDDGKLRRFKAGYLHFLEPVDLPLDEALELSEELERKLEIAEARTVAKREAKKTGRRLMTLKDQVAIFRHLYPQGFEDPKFMDAHRGGEDGGLKRHWDKTVAHAQELLARERLERLLADKDYAQIMATARELSSEVTLTSSKKHRGVLGELPAEAEAEAAEALVALLHGEGKYSERFDRWVKALKASPVPPTWPVATLPAALLRSHKHIAVKPSAFRSQMRWMAPTAKLDNLPDGSAYRRLRRMVQRMVERLEATDLAPRDLVDVHAFIWETMRPKNVKLLPTIEGAR